MPRIRAFLSELERGFRFLEDFEAADWVLSWNGTSLLLLEDFEAGDW